MSYEGTTHPHQVRVPASDGSDRNGEHSAGASWGCGRRHLIWTIPRRNQEFSVYPQAGSCEKMPSVMIKRIIIEGYRCFSSLDLQPNVGLNIIVGDNEAGKSTLLEAIALALTNKVNGKWASDELNPFWFNQDLVGEFFDKYGTEEALPTPEIYVELHLSNEDEVQRLRGVHNSLQVDSPGVSLRIKLASSYSEAFDAYMTSTPPKILPVEFYEVEWKDFADHSLTKRPRELATSIIDSRTVRSSSGVDYHTRQMLGEHLAESDRALVSLEYRKSQQALTTDVLSGINAKIAATHGQLHDKPIGLQMDQSSKSAWETVIVPQVDDIPFSMIGQGQQAMVKLALAMARTNGVCTFVLVEEPENHLSHTALMRLLKRIEELTSGSQQVFITTHSSYVLNRLGLDQLILLNRNVATRLTALPPDTVAYFRKLSGYDTLRLVLARKLVLVEGPSDAIILERAFRDTAGQDIEAAGVDIVSMRGLSFKRALEVCKSLDRQALALQDNDGKDQEEVLESLDGLLSQRRQMLVSDKANGPTLEPQIVAVNIDATLRLILGLTARANLVTWMTNNKTEAALKIFDSSTAIKYPEYIERAVADLQ